MSYHADPKKWMELNYDAILKENDELHKEAEKLWQVVQSAKDLFECPDLSDDIDEPFVIKAAWIRLQETLEKLGE